MTRRHRARDWPGVSGAVRESLPACHKPSSHAAYGTISGVAQGGSVCRDFRGRKMELPLPCSKAVGHDDGGLPAWASRLFVAHGEQLVIRLSSGCFELWRAVGNLLENVLDALKHFCEASLLRKRRDPEVVTIWTVEARPRRDQHVLLL